MLLTGVLQLLAIETRYLGRDAGKALLPLFRRNESPEHHASI